MRKTFASMIAASLLVVPPAVSANWANCTCGALPATCNEVLVVFEDEATETQKDAFETYVNDNSGQFQPLGSEGGIGERFYLAKFDPAEHDSQIDNHLSSLAALNGVKAAECNFAVGILGGGVSG